MVPTARTHIHEVSLIPSYGTWLSQIKEVKFKIDSLHELSLRDYL